MSVARLEHVPALATAGAPWTQRSPPPPHPPPTKPPTPPPLNSAWSNKLITAKDHASVQINIGHLDESGVYTGQFTTFALAGKVRSGGDADSALDIMWRKKAAELLQ